MSLKSLNHEERVGNECCYGLVVAGSGGMNVATDLVCREVHGGMNGCKMNDDETRDNN